jgi:hypothetical protein
MARKPRRVQKNAVANKPQRAKAGLKRLEAEEADRGGRGGRTAIHLGREKHMTSEHEEAKPAREESKEIRTAVRVLTARLERLSKELHRKLEHLDPTDDPEWEQLEDHDREFYRQCIKTLIVDLATEASKLETT